MKPRETALLLLVVLLGAGLRVAFLLSPGGGANADETVFGLMALRISRGQEWPVFCWGAHYAGAVVSYLAAPLIVLFGTTELAIKAASLPFALGGIAVAGLWGRRVAGATGGVLCALLVAVPLPVFFRFSVMSHGGYPETFLLGTAFWLLLLAGEAEEDPIRRRKIWALAGFVAGVGTYILWMILPFLAAGVAAVFFSPSRGDLPARIRHAALPCLLGILPLLLYNVVHPLASFLRAGGRAAGETSLRDPIGYARELDTGLGELFAPWGGHAAAGLAIVFLLAVGFLRRRDLAGRMILLFLPFWFAFAGLTGLDRARHWTPLYLAVALAIPLLPRPVAAAIGGFVLLANVAAIPIDRAPREDPVACIAAALDAKGTDRVLAGYDIAYPLTYRTGERILVSPVLGPNPTERQPEYPRAVLSARRAAVLLPRGADRNVFHARWDTWTTSLGTCGEWEILLPDVPPERLLSTGGR